MPIHETLIVGICLALVGGFLDAYTYLLRGGVFANAQTGNMVLMGIHAAEKDFRGAFYYFVPITAFFIGVLITEYIKKNFTGRQWFEWQQVVMIIEIVLLFLIGFLPKQIPNAVVNVTISFICSLQANSFRKTNGLTYVTTMCTGNLRSAAENFFNFLSATDKAAGENCARYFLIILSFCVGAVSGVIIAGLFHEKAVWSCCILLLTVFYLMVKK